MRIFQKTPVIKITKNTEPTDFLNNFNHFLITRLAAEKVKGKTGRIVGSAKAIDNRAARVKLIETAQGEIKNAGKNPVIYMAVIRKNLQTIQKATKDHGSSGNRRNLGN